MHAYAWSMNKSSTKANHCCPKLQKQIHSIIRELKSDIEMTSTLIEQVNNIKL